MSTCRESIEEYDRVLASSRRPVCVYFTTPTCPGCKLFNLTFSRLRRKYSSRVRFVKANLMEVGELVRRYDLVRTPTVVVLRGDREVQRFVGFPLASSVGRALDEALLDRP